jgi:glycine dehydrogenase
MSTHSLDELFDRDGFSRRHIGTLDSADLNDMLQVIGVESVAALIDKTVPEAIRLRADLPLPSALTETEVTAELRKIASMNRPRRSLIGMGYTGTITPPVIRRNVLENPSWYTSYTPYQPEISQGRLESLLNFQTVISDLTGLPIANASLLDEATAAAEAMTMARRASKSKSTNFFIHRDTHPQTISVMATRAEPLGIDLIIGDTSDLQPEDLFGALFSYPTSTGSISDWSTQIAAVKAAGAVAIVVTDPLACVLLTSPGQLGADIAVGSAQRFGVPMGFVDRTPHSWQQPRLTREVCPVVWLESVPIPKVAPHCVWRCRHASNIFVVKKQPAISARLKLCSPISLVFMQPGTDQRACNEFLVAFNV